ncbi:MAG: hypothetical protein HYX99_04785 [Chloroflexi bacterium]|nr:hypothetical protein [Chloroflexota bacterium]
MNTKSTNLVSAAIYLGLSLLAALGFFAITLAGDYTWVARIGGGLWIFMLGNIVLMPLVIPWAKRRWGA